MRTWTLGIVVVALSACRDAASDDAGDTEPACEGAKCDELAGSTGGSSTSGSETEAPVDDAIAQTCERRRDDAFNPNQLAFTSEALRWSCDDVEEVQAFERGQE